MDTYDQQAEVLRVMAHPIRLRILDILQGDSECVCHLSVVLGRSQPYVSQQLAVLRESGLVTVDKDGNNSFYRLANEQVARQVGAILPPTAGQPSNGDGGCHHSIDGCVCPKCRQVDLSAAC